MYDHDRMDDDSPDERKTLWLLRGQTLVNKRETEKAVAIDTGEEEEFAPGRFRNRLIWLPKSVVQIAYLPASDKVDIKLPFWLAEKLGLEDVIEEID